MNKWLVGVAVLLIGLWMGYRDGPFTGPRATPVPSIEEAAAGDAAATPGTGDRVIAEAFADQRSSVQVASSGVVSRVLADDNNGSRHQRMVVRLATGQTVLIAHNIDLAPRVESLKAGDEIAFYGEYEWNPEGGVIHWTHHDPAGRHEAGWLEVAGRRYQ